MAPRARLSNNAMRYVMSIIAHPTTTRYSDHFGQTAQIVYLGIENFIISRLDPFCRRRHWQAAGSASKKGLLIRTRYPKKMGGKCNGKVEAKSYVYGCRRSDLEPKTASCHSTLTNLIICTLESQKCCNDVFKLILNRNSQIWFDALIRRLPNLTDETETRYFLEKYCCGMDNAENKHSSLAWLSTKEKSLLLSLSL